jgi:hypothetical protein
MEASMDNPINHYAPENTTVDKAPRKLLNSAKGRPHRLHLSQESRQLKAQYPN